MFIYSCIPKDMLDVDIVPLIKDKTGDLSSKDNYRPISLSCIVSKLFEKIILNRCERYLYTSDNQFAFKKGHSTELCIYVLKQIILNYNDNKSPIFSCFLDIKKAFDRVNNNKLIDILYKRGVPVYILNILALWFQKQIFYVNWDNYKSPGFNPSCGLRQGSTLSPLLFNVYLDYLSTKLNLVKAGCVVGNFIFNHICYADDMVLFAPSYKGLQMLVNICQSVGLALNIIFNERKSKCMTFYHKSYPQNNIKISLNANIIENVDNVVYLGVILNNRLDDNEEIKRQYRGICA